MSTVDRESILKEKNLQLFRGLPISDKFNIKVIEDILSFVPANDDVILATYPKTGTHWTCYIIHQILTMGESFPTVVDAMYNVMPSLGVCGIEAVEKISTRPRLYRHHFPYDMMKKNIKAKIVYVYRKPEDTLVSFYHFLNEMKRPVFVELDDFVEDFLFGNVLYGQYFDHILSFYRHKGDGNIHFVSYEKLMVDRKQEILRLAKFLGTEYYNLLTQNESVINKVLEHTDFSYMKKNLFLDFAKYPHNLGFEDKVFKRINLFRKGTSGEGKKTLKEVQLRRLAEQAEKKLEGTDILFEWLNK